MKHNKNYKLRDTVSIIVDTTFELEYMTIQIIRETENTNTSMVY